MRAADGSPLISAPVRRTGCRVPNQELPDPNSRSKVTVRMTGTTMRRSYGPQRRLRRLDSAVPVAADAFWAGCSTDETAMASPQREFHVVMGSPHGGRGLSPLADPVMDRVLWQNRRSAVSCTLHPDCRKASRVSRRRAWCSSVEWPGIPAAENTRPEAGRRSRASMGHRCDLAERYAAAAGDPAAKANRLGRRWHDGG